MNSFVFVFLNMGQSEIRSCDSHVTSCTFEGRSTSPSRSRAREIFTSLKFGNLKIPGRQCHSESGCHWAGGGVLST